MCKNKFNENKCLIIKSLYRTTWNNYKLAYLKLLIKSNIFLTVPQYIMQMNMIIQVYLKKLAFKILITIMFIAKFGEH